MKSLLIFAGAVAALVVERQAASPALPGASAIPRLEDQKTIDGGKRARVSVGHYDLPANGMTTSMNARLTQPCTDCYITAAQANLLYEDGSEANVDTGAWLHHIVLTGIPEPGIMWASGNERPTIRFNNKYKYGWHFPSTMMLSCMIDLMNNAADNKKVQVVIDFEYIPKAQATGYQSLYMEWLNIGFPAPKTGKFSFSSIANWTSPFNGKLLYTIGHMHDGGVDAHLYKNGQEICRSMMLYNARPHYVVPLSNSTMKGMDKSELGDTSQGVEWHISGPGVCEDFGTIKKGDVLASKVDYDLDKYGTMMHGDEKESLMGNVRVYMGPDSS